MKRRSIALLLLLVAVATTGFAQQPQTNARAEAYYHFSRAKLLDDQGQSAQAIEEYKKALAERKDYIPAAQGLGRIRGYLN